MENIYIDSTPKTPKVSFSYGVGKLEITGRSIPENSSQFYEPLLKWLDSYYECPKSALAVNLKFDYFNTNSSMYILGILKKLERIFLKGVHTDIKWYYVEDDEDMQQAGEDMKQIVKVPIEMIEISDQFSNIK